MNAQLQLQPSNIVFCRCVTSPLYEKTCSNRVVSIKFRRLG